MKKCTLIALALLLLTTSSCIVFEKQTLTFRYDKAKDQLLIFQVYEGIYGEDSDQALDENETKQIASVLEGERTFFFANWIFEYNRAAVEKAVKEAAEEAPGEDETPERIEATQEAVALAKLILANAKVENGRLFLNDEQKLSGSQCVTLNNASKVVAQANRVISAAVTAMDAPEQKESGKPSLETVRRMKAAADGGHAWIALDGCCIRVRVPLAYEDVKEWRRDVSEDMARDLALTEGREEKLVEIVRGLADLLGSEVWASYVGDTLEVALGHPSNSRSTLALTLHGSKYKPNVVAFAKQHGGIAETVDLAKLMDRFLGEPGAAGKEPVQP